MSASVDPDRSVWDVIVLGAAAAGENAAQYATQFSGLSAVMVEDELVGGECSYWACMPSKALLRPIEVQDTAQNLPGVQSLTDGAVLDVQAVLARRDAIVNHLDDASQVQWSLHAGIDVIRGYARLTGARTLEVTAKDGSTRTISARHAIVIDTGSRAAVPPIPGLREALPWVSRDVTNVHDIPRRAAILGGGVVACEAATWLRGLGVQELTILNRGDGLLGSAEPFAGELVAHSLRDSGVEVRLGRTIASVSRSGAVDAGPGLARGAEAILTLDDGSTLVVDEIIVAAGRAPNSDDIGLASIGLEAGGYLDVDDQMTVRGVDGLWLYAIGDVTGRALLTHMGKYQARIVGEVIAARAVGGVDRPATDGISELSVTAGHRAVPHVTFTNPEVGSAGRTEAQARADGVSVETVEYDLAALAGSSVLRDGYVGRAKLVVDRDTDTVVGATFVGLGIAELVHSATVAIVAKTPLSTLWHAVPSYPTVSEIWLRLLETLRTQRRKAAGDSGV
jgi:pyruvate/2-oxoglutarate dehydrogenase complex dihydrolipoamide dehydrogenase (E3) component